MRYDKKAKASRRKKGKRDTQPHRQLQRNRYTVYGRKSSVVERAYREMRTEQELSRKSDGIILPDIGGVQFAFPFSQDPQGNWPE